ncbi:hypothetical protein ES703_21036 [subsurface metagenome]
MVKVTGPQFSITALGKFGKVLVYSVWKGIQYVRMLVTPTNPQSGAQGDRRVMLGGLGRSAKYCQVDKVFTNFAKVVTPAGQSWISYYVNYIMKTYFFNEGAYNGLYTEFIDHPSAGDYSAQAVALGLVTFTLPYKQMDFDFLCGFQLYCLAKYSTDQYLLDNTKFNAAPYTKALADWLLADIELMVADFTV